MTHAKRTLAYAGLLFLSLLAGCPKKQTDYNAIQQDSARSQKSLDQEKGPMGQ